MKLRRKNIKINKEVQFLYENLKNYNKTGKYLDDDLLEFSVKNYYGIPYNSEYNSVIKSPFVIAMAIQDNINKNRNHIMDMEISFLKSEEQNLTVKYIMPRSNYVRVRLLNNDNQGVIPRNDFLFEDMAYTFIEDTPIIITKVLDYEETLEFNELHTKELKFLTALTFLNIYGHNTYQLHIKRGFISIPTSISANEQFFHEHEIDNIKLIIKLISRLKNSFVSIIFKNNGSNYYPEDKQLQNRLRLFLKLYDEKNEVLKRSSYLLYKSNMLFRDNSYLFQEEAYTLLTIAIEGILKLIAIDKFGKFVHEEVFQYIEKALKYGFYYRERLISIYESRTELVHPINDYDISWNKDISHDDYTDDMDIARQLLYFYVTGEELEIHFN